MGRTTGMMRSRVKRPRPYPLTGKDGTQHEDDGRILSCPSWKDWNDPPLKVCPLELEDAVYGPKRFIPPASASDEHWRPSRMPGGGGAVAGASLCGSRASSVAETRPSSPPTSPSPLGVAPTTTSTGTLYLNSISLPPPAATHVEEECHAGKNQVDGFVREPRQVHWWSITIPGLEAVCR